MQDSFNPYASPNTEGMHPKAYEWLGSPNERFERWQMA